MKPEQDRAEDVWYQLRILYAESNQYWRTPRNGLCLCFDWGLVISSKIFTWEELYALGDWGFIEAATSRYWYITAAGMRLLNTPLSRS